MKWIKKDYKGNTQVWYSEDIILRIREIATGGVIAKHNQECKEILEFLNEVDFIEGEKNV